MARSCGPYRTVVAACASCARSRSVVLEPGVIGALSRVFSARDACCGLLRYFGSSFDRSPGFLRARARNDLSLPARALMRAALGGPAGFLADGFLLAGFFATASPSALAALHEPADHVLLAAVALPRRALGVGGQLALVIEPVLLDPRMAELHVEVAAL